MARIAYLCSDLLFVSKIRETARLLGHEAAGARDLAGLPGAARGAERVIVDLRLPFALEAVRALRADPAAAAVPVIGFCEHERTELMDQARAAGCTHALAKGRF